jgi:hypothetical protein
VITPEYAINILRKPYATEYMRFVATSPCAVLTAPAPNAPPAEGPNEGQTWIAPGDWINVGDTSNGWLWVGPPNEDKAPGLGFVPGAYARPA